SGVEGHYGCRSRRDGGRDDARPAGNIKKVAVGCFGQCRPKAVRDLVVSLLRPEIERLSLSSKFVRDALDVIHVFPAGLQGIANIMLAWVRMSPHGSGVGLLEQHQGVYARLRGLCETQPSAPSLQRWVS